MELEVERAASRPALAVRVGRVESPPFREQLRVRSPRAIICMAEARTSPRGLR